MKRKNIPESEPINFVLQVKMSGNAIPYEYGYNTKEEADENKIQWEWFGGPRFRWAQVIEKHEFQYPRHHNKQGTTTKPIL